MARETAYEFGLRLTFLGKPFPAKAGSGLHVNLSLATVDGHNALHDPDAADGLSALARQCIGGMLAHHRGLAALCASTVNAYKRLQVASLSGLFGNWGHDHRCAAVRVPAHRGDATRLEHRMPDGAANPYLAAAAVLQAARLGVVEMQSAPEPETGDGIESINTDVRVAEHLGAALDDLEADGALGRSGRPRSGGQPGRRQAGRVGQLLRVASRLGGSARSVHRLGTRLVPAVPLTGLRTRAPRSTSR